MKNESAIADQKVYTTLDAVLELQKEIQRLGNTEFANGLRRAAAILKLPVHLV